MTRGIWIDTENKKLSIVNVATLRDLQRYVDGDIQSAHQWPNSDILYVDVDGHQKEPRRYFRVADRAFPLVGNGLIIGCAMDGEQVDVEMTLEEAQQIIEFRTREQIAAWAKANASEPAVALSFPGRPDKVVARVGEFYT